MRILTVLVIFSAIPTVGTYAFAYYFGKDPLLSWLALQAQSAFPIFALIFGVVLGLWVLVHVIR